MVLLSRKYAAISTTTSAINVVGMREVRPLSEFFAMNRAEVPKFLMLVGITASCLEARVPCIKPLNTLEEPKVTIIAGSSK